MTLAFAPQATSLSCCASMNLGMAQLALRGISEDWWLKHLGDVHWQLIAQAVGQNTTVFRDKRGRQLYAAFCATEFEQARPDLVSLGECIEVISELWCAGRSRIQSNHSLMVKGVEIAKFKLISTFVTHSEAGVNASVRRATPYLIPVLDPAPDDFGARASALAKAQKAEGLDRFSNRIACTPIAGDFNAVGLLYFPSFTRFLEQTESLSENLESWSPVARRTILYLANIERGEQIFRVSGKDDFVKIDLWKGSRDQMRQQKLAHCLVSRLENA